MDIMNAMNIINSINEFEVNNGLALTDDQITTMLNTFEELEEEIIETIIDIPLHELTNYDLRSIRLLLKIGRLCNTHFLRRIKEGLTKYDIELVRYYTNIADSCKQIIHSLYFNHMHNRNEFENDKGEVTFCGWSNPIEFILNEDYNINGFNSYDEMINEFSDGWDNDIGLPFEGNTEWDEGLIFNC